MILINKIKTKAGKDIELSSLVEPFYNKIFSAQKKRLKELNKWRPVLIIDRNKKIEFIRILIKDHEALIKDKPDLLYNRIMDYESKGFNALLFDEKANEGKGKQTAFGGLIETLFGYGNFRNSKTAIWLADQLSIKACPYCNSQYILSYDKSVKPIFLKELFKGVKDKSKRALFEFDHFFPKSRYPYLSTSFYNLIPSCKPCNNVKGNTKTDLINYIHPYHRDFNNLFEYDCSDKDIVDFILSKKKFEEIEVTLKSREKGANEIILKNHIRIFDLAKIAQLHKDIIEELYLKSYFYNDSRKKELLEMKIEGTNVKLFTKELLDRFILGNYSLDSDINKRPLSKMTKDIAEKINLLK